MRISELAASAGVPTSTVRYYERVGLMALPVRTPSGYRDYGPEAASRLLFIARARQLGLTCVQISALIQAWAGTDCGAARQGVVGMIEQKQDEIAQRIRELRELGDQLAAVRAELLSAPPAVACRSDLGCCVPASASGVTVMLELSRSPR